MNNAFVELISKLCNGIKNIPPKDRKNAEGVEIVFMDIINGHPKQSRAFTFADVVEALARNSTPIGLILFNWDEPEGIRATEFADTPPNASELVTYALAEAQDEMREDMKDDE